MDISDPPPRSCRHHQFLVQSPSNPLTHLMPQILTNSPRAKMYGQFDPKWLYIYCVLGFEIGSAVCGAAPSMNALIIGRAIAGLGGAGMYLGVIMLLSIFTTETERPNYFAMLGGTFGLGTVFVLPFYPGLPINSQSHCSC